MNNRQASRVSFLVFFVFLCAAALCPHAFGVPYYVSDSAGSDASNGTSWLAAKKTIQAAVNVATNGGDVINADSPAGQRVQVPVRTIVSNETPVSARLVNEGSSSEFASDLHLYFNVDEEPEANQERRELEADVAAHRVAGVVFARLPYNLSESPLLKIPGIPRVVIASGSEGMACLYPDHAALIERGLSDLMARGRKRIAVLLAEGLLEGQVRRIETVLKRNGIKIPPFWIQRAALHTPASARGIVHLLMQGCPRPDGLLILDDNLVEGACAGLIAAGIRVPQDVDVVAHHNFPLPSSGALPMHRIGFDARAILRDCMALIAMQRRGETPTGVKLVPASFEEEMEAVVGAPVRG